MLYRGSEAHKTTNPTKESEVNLMNIAILIDAENVLPGHADLIFSHAQKLGVVVSKEIFGASSALSSWVAPVLKYAIHPNLTIKAAKGKNSSDIALVIGAMDLLVRGGIDCAIIASSDSDFSALSVRLRNAGIEVVGMGTEKSNELWRTACSSFVVLQNQKPSQSARQESALQAEAKQGGQRQQAAKKPARPVATTHEERIAVIGKLILKRLESHGGRMQTSTLFPSLNQLPEYRVDRQGSGKKPLNYLTSTYGDTFHFEDAADGQNWVSLPGVDPVEPSPAPKAEEAPDETPSEAAPEAPAPRSEPEAEPARDDGDYVTPQQVTDRLVAGGFEADIARQVTEIFADSTSYRAAYNKLRSVFGNTTGRDYYQQAKEILTASEE
jgi:hypothetical protein